MQDNIARVLGACLAVTFFTVAAAEAQTIVDLGTAGNAAHFLITGAGATAAPAKQRSNGIGVDAIVNGIDTFINGGSLANFDGYWYADENFLVPPGATNVSLTFSGLSADDRVVLELNGSILADFGLQSGTTNPYVGPGLMKLTDPGLDAPYTFTGVTSGTVTMGFQTGVNTLRLIVNNTNGGATGTTQTFVASNGDVTYTALIATLSYTPPPIQTNDILTVGTTGHGGAVFEVKADGTRSILSDFTNASQGLNLASFGGVDVNAYGKIFLGAYNANFAGYACNANVGCIETLDSQGNRTQFSSFDVNPFATNHDLAFDTSGNIIVADGNRGRPLVLKVFPDGSNQILSDFADTTEGPVGGQPWGVGILPDSVADQLVLPHGSVVIVDNLGGTVCRSRFGIEQLRRYWTGVRQHL